jgi:hypothetical protein
MNELKILQADLELVVKDEYGKEVERKEQPSHSWTKNFYNYIYAQVAGIYCTTTVYGTQVVDITGSVIVPFRGFDPNTYFQMRGIDNTGIWMSGSNSITGCRVGTDTANTIESFGSYALLGVCPSGTAANAFVISVGTSTFSTASAGTVLKCKQDRTFTNNSGGNIAVTESGLYGIYENALAASTHLMNRDTFGAINVANGNSLFVAYTIKLTLPQAIHT